MIGAMYTGISGLNANATAMSVVGDNISNVNTVGFKSSRASFANILSKSVVGSTKQEIGMGTRFWATDPSWAQGSFENTGSPTDLAINGKGLFVLKDSAGAPFYTRAGNFNFNRDGDLVNTDGLVVQGYPIDDSGRLGVLANVNVAATSTSPASASTQMTLGANLDSNAAVSDTYSVALNVYDSLGTAIPLNVEFTKASNNTWDWSATVPTSFVGSGNEEVGTGQLVFANDGSLSSNSGSTTNPSVSIPLINGATTPLDITWNMFDAGGASSGGITQYSSDFAYTFKSQDGYTSGVLKEISTDADGIVSGSYSNGEHVPLYQLALADFPSYYGLTKLADTLYQESTASGQPVLGTAGRGTLGVVVPAALEMSNVDLAEEFVKLITTQRAFQANSKVITTSDEMLGDLISIKR